MKNYYTIITLTSEEIKNHPFITKDGKADFYRFVVPKAINAAYDEIESLDCRKINVATNIEEEWFRYAKENDMDKADLAMMILCNGPKALEHLINNTVEIEAGAIEW